MNESHIKQRLAYIDGLRAIAVISVILYHFEFYFISQGLLGVDIFFVISGFVVSKSLFSSFDRADGDFYGYISQFYKRRVWRIMPALLVMLLVTLLLTALLIPPAYLSSSILFTGAAAVGGVANIVLMLGQNTNYFDQLAAYNPFLHTWSLGVEEQFYLIFPVLVWGIFRYAKSRSTFNLVLTALSLVSIACAIWWSFTSPSTAFYSLFLASGSWQLAPLPFQHRSQFA
nr:acyltransferase [Marinicella sp. W31]MDC2877298.1 acyltransferase [Marinicella sp. W31]